MEPQRADAGIFLPGKEVRVTELYGKANSKLFGKSELLGKFLKTFHVEEEKLDEEIYDTDGSNRAGML